MLKEKIITSNCGLPALGLALGLGMIGSAYIIGNTVKDIQLSHQNIEVKGYAERDVVSDMAIWNFKISVREKTLEEAYKNLKVAEQKLDQYLKNIQISPQQVNRFPTQTSEMKKIIEGPNGSIIQSNEVEYYDVRREFSIQSKDVYKIKEAAEKASILPEQGVYLDTLDIKYFATDISNIKTELLGEATKNAVIRAQQLAQNSGSTVGVVRSMRQGIFQITEEFSTDVSDYGVSDTSSIKKKAKAVAALTFSIGK